MNKELELQNEVTVMLDQAIYSEQMRKKYGKEVKCKILSMNGYYEGCDLGQIFYQGIICKDNQSIYIPSRKLIKQNIICQSNNSKEIEFIYNNKKYKGYLDHIENGIKCFIGKDNLIYKIK